MTDETNINQNDIVLREQRRNNKTFLYVYTSLLLVCPLLLTVADDPGLLFENFYYERSSWTLSYGRSLIHISVIMVIVLYTMREYIKQDAHNEAYSGINRSEFDGILNLTKNDQFEKVSRVYLVRELSTRVSGIKLRLTFVLLTIGAALISAVMIVIFAGRLTSLDAAAVGPTDRLKSELRDIDNQLVTLTEMRSSLRRQDDLRNIARRSDAEQKEYLELTGKISRGIVSSDYSAPKDINAIDEEIKSNRKRKDSLIELTNQAWAKELINEKGYGDTKYIIATAITRLGVVVILVFLVQILLGLYRYNMRLLTYYNTQIDKIMIWNGDPAQLKTLSENFAVPKIDFGKEPNHPLKEVVQAVDKYMSKNKGNKSSNTPDEDSQKP